MTVKRIVCSLLCAAALLSCTFSVSAAPYRSYLFERETDTALNSPAAAVPDGTVSGITLGVGSFKEPGDIFEDKSGNIYILDSGNSRIVCLDEKLKNIRFVLKTENEFDFTGARGIFVNEGYIYIADTANARILKFTVPESGFSADVFATAEIIKPAGLILENDTVFKPLKLAVDSMDRIFTVCEGVYDGLIELAPDGAFLAYVGSNKISLSFGERLWRMFATREQWNASEKTVPVEFSNITPDSEGFMFTTARGNSDGSLMIRRLNLSGADVLNSDEDTVLGDKGLTPEDDGTYFVDVAVGGSEMFAGLDQTRGRVFVYNGDCEFLFEFGGLGSQVGCFKNPTALLWLSDNRFCVLDASAGEITLFRPTKYGSTLLSSVVNEVSGNYGAAREDYDAVLSMNSNNEYAYSGKGKQYYRNGDYKKALYYLKLGNNKQYYSKAFTEYRKEILNVAIPVFIICVIVLTVLLLSVSLYKKLRAAKKRIADIKEMSLKIRERREKEKSI